MKATWSVLFANVAFNYQRYFTYVWVAAYSTDMLKAPVSFAAACMFWSNLADIAFAIAVGKVADALAKSGRMSTLSIRRLFAAVGFLGTGPPCRSKTSLSLYMYVYIYTHTYIYIYIYI